jgi:molecular chaperone DnaK (HSP70)
LHVLARDLKSGRERIVEMKSAVDVNDADVQRMVEESVDHAFEDLRSRRWIETKLRAQETVKLARKGLIQCESETSDEESDQIQKSIKAVETALATEDAKILSGDLEQLKAAIEQLDQTTQPLAERLMDKAMEAALRKRGLIS